MASSLNRPAILLNLVAFFGVSVFCISTDAPIITQDILRRCQDTLLMHCISIRGLAVSGRDVELSGDSLSAILSPRAHSAVEAVSGVRVVTTRIVAVDQASGLPPTIDRAPASSVLPQASLEPLPQEVQRKIDRILENQGISFKTDTTDLRPESELALNEITSYLTEAPSLLCEIRGYDSQPPPGRQNWILALQRALAVGDYLESKGIADWRLSTRAFHVGEDTGGRRSDRPLDLVVRAKE